MAAAGVPIIPGFSAQNLSDPDIAVQARAIGYPILIKASAGGGGKGMRIVHDAAQLTAALEAARREAKSAFGDDTLLIERYFEAPRHIEVQILGDAHGNLIHCFERECSIQRRYQKIIEEAPSPAVDEKLRARMTAAAIAAGRAIGYQNAGTVEFVADQQGQFYFLEVNTRLQVEHPVTEEITGLDLVRLQILIAEGAPLPLRQDDLVLRGHAIECRIYAEDPYADFLPSIGTLVCWEQPPTAGVRYESGVETGSEVTIYYDPMLAKVIAHGPTRPETARRISKALNGMRVHGVRTNLPLLLQVLRHPEFLAGRLDTHFIAKHRSRTRDRDGAVVAGTAARARTRTAEHSLGLAQQPEPDAGNLVHQQRGNHPRWLLRAPTPRRAVRRRDGTRGGGAFLRRATHRHHPRRGAARLLARLACRQALRAQPARHL
jgi:propionyl-CoA carboxylase alpha chain